MSSDGEFCGDDRRGPASASSEDEPLPGQTEYNLPSREELALLRGEEAFTAAVDATLRDFPAGAAPPAGVVDDARERARQLLDEAGAEDREGLRDMHNLTLSMGLPATRAMFRQMVRASGRRGAAKRAAAKEIADFSPVTELGCLKVDFYDLAGQRPDTAYLTLGECPKGHDLGAQLDKIKPRVAPEKWQEVLKHLSMLVFTGRNVYANTARQHLPLIRALFGLAPSDPCERYLDLQVDPANTTLYLDAGWPSRVGIFVSTEAEARAK